MRIKLIKSNAKITAEKILSGELPPVTGSIDVIEQLVSIAYEKQLDVSFYREETNRIEIINLETMSDVLDQQIEMRPFSKTGD